MAQSVIISKNPRPIRIRGYAGPIDLPSYWGNDLDQYAAALKVIAANATRGKGRPSTTINNPSMATSVSTPTGAAKDLSRDLVVPLSAVITFARRWA